MNHKIYISRKCEYCHELLIILHKNKDILKFPVIDIHSNSYPKIVKSVLFCPRFYKVFIRCDLLSI